MPIKHTLPEGVDGDFIAFESSDPPRNLPFEVQDVEGDFVCRCKTREMADAIKHALNAMPSFGEGGEEDRDG